MPGGLSNDLSETALAVALVTINQIQAQRSRARMRTLAAWAVMLDGLDSDDDDELDGEDGPPAPKRSRRVFPRGDYGQSEWAIMLRCEELKDPTSREARSFRRRFRIPYGFFVQLMALTKRKKLFPTAEKDVVGRQCVPTELKVGLVVRHLDGDIFKHRLDLHMHI